MYKGLLFFIVLMFSIGVQAIQSPSMSSSKSSMYLGDTTELSWSKPSGTAYFHLWVIKPSQSPLKFRSNYTGTSFSRWIQNYPGTHTFYVEACDGNGACASSNSVSVYMQERPTIPATPGEPNVNWDLYHPVGASIRVKIPSISGADYYQVYNGTSTTSTTVSRTFYSSTWEYIPSVASGPNYIRIKACNSAGCSSESTPRRIVIFNNPSAPNLAISSTTVGKGGTVKVDWNRPDGLIWSGAYFKLSCINNSGSDVCAQTIPHIGGSNKSEYSYSFTANSISAYDIQVKACNKTDSYCSSSATRTAYVIPAVPGDPGYSVDWDFYYPQNTTMTVKLPQSIEGADSYDVYYYKENSSPQVRHVAKSQQSITLNVGAAGYYQLQLAACVTSRSGAYQCSSTSQGRRIVSFEAPVAPTVSVTPELPELDSDVTVTWNRPDKLIWSGGYFKLSCVVNGTDVCNQKIDHIGGSNKSEYTYTFKASTPGDYYVQVKACNKSDVNCTSSNLVKLSTQIPTHGDPSFNVDWDFYYPENTNMTVALSQSIAGADSFDVYYYPVNKDNPDSSTPKKIAHVSKAKKTYDINVGNKGWYRLQLAACVTSDSGSYRCGEKSKAIRIVSFSNPDAPLVSVTPESPDVSDTVKVNWNRPGNLIYAGGYFKVSCKAENGTELCGQKIDHIGGSNKAEYTHELKVSEAAVVDFKVTACNKTDANCTVSNTVRKTIGQPLKPVLSATQREMFLGGTTVLSWTNPKNAKVFNIWVEKPEQEPLLIRQGYTQTFLNRWIQNYPGVHSFYVEACQDNGECVTSNRLNITMKEGRAEQYPVMTSEKSSMVLGDKTLLSWTKPAGTTSFKLWVIKPEQEALLIREGYTETSLNRWIQNYPGIHTFYVEACNAQGECFSSNRVEVNMHYSLGTLEDLGLEASERSFINSKDTIKWQFAKAQERQYELTLFVQEPGSSQYVELASSSNNQAGSFDYLFEASGDYFFYVQACALVEQQQIIPIIMDGMFIPISAPMSTASRACSDLEPTKTKVSVMNTEFVPENLSTKLQWPSVPGATRVVIESAACADASDCDFASLDWDELATLTNGETSFGLSNSAGKVYRIKVCFSANECTSWINIAQSKADRDLYSFSEQDFAPSNDSNTLSLPDDKEGGIVLTTPGEFRVDESGNATYNVPFDLPAGSGGIQPQLGLSYSSSNKRMGAAGIGWSLAGMSSITRCGKSH
ncbi:hypothetical protein HG263_16570, partial [Pseudoalteromonas sp. JBTF-M23]